MKLEPPKVEGSIVIYNTASPLESPQLTVGGRARDCCPTHAYSSLQLSSMNCKYVHVVNQIQQLIALALRLMALSAPNLFFGGSLGPSQQLSGPEGTRARVLGKPNGQQKKLDLPSIFSTGMCLDIFEVCSIDVSVRE